MNLSMLVKVAGSREGLVTHLTHIRLFSCVCSDMNHKIARLMESPVTLGADVLLIPHVNFYMSPQVASIGKILFTVRAGEGLIPCVDSTVIVHLTGP